MSLSFIFSCPSFLKRGRIPGPRVNSLSRSFSVNLYQSRFSSLGFMLPNPFASFRMPRGSILALWWPRAWYARTRSWTLRWLETSDPSPCAMPAAMGTPPVALGTNVGGGVKACDIGISPLSMFLKYTCQDMCTVSGSSFHCMYISSM